MIQFNFIKKALPCLAFLTLHGCQVVSQAIQKITPYSSTSITCPKEHKVPLERRNVKPVDLNTEITQLSGLATQDIHLGFTFRAQAGQKLSQRTTDKVCIWVFTPDNQLVTNGELPLSGEYTIQIASSQGYEDFNLQVTLGDALSSQSQPITLASSSPTHTSNTCPKTPNSYLEVKNVKSVELNNQITNLSGIATQNTNPGFTFTAEAGQKLSQRTTDKICVWVFAPDTQLVTGKDLPMTGRYTIQIATLQGSGNFNVQMSLGDDPFSQAPASPSPNPVLPSPVESSSPSSSSVSSQNTTQPVSSPTSSTLSRSDFPKDSCGDSRPTSRQDYPINFYPVNAPFSDENLKYIQSNFCRDAYQKISEESNSKIIQIASFTSKSRASDLAALVNPEIQGFATVGEPTLVNWE